MFALIEYVRQLKQQGVPISIFAFARTGQHRHIGRDAALARSIRSFHAEHPKLRMVILTGNVHASQAPVLQIGQSRIVPTGYLLRDLHPTSVFLAYPTGTAWVCKPDCGIHKIDSSWDDMKPDRFYSKTPMDGYAMSYLLSGITASPPAVDASH